MTRMPDDPHRRYSRHVYFNADDKDYVALCTEFPYLSAFGETQEEALEALEAEIDEAICIYADEGWPLPEPEPLPKPEMLPNGRCVTRLRVDETKRWKRVSDLPLAILEPTSSES